jgi:hypothetical protein
VSQEQDQETARRARAQEVGLFRYALIADALDEALRTKQRGRLVRAVAARLHPGPFGPAPVRVSRAGLDRWIRAYRAGGFAALVPAPRRLAAQTPTEVLELAAALKTEAPGRTAAQVAVVLAAHAGWAPSPRTLQWTAPGPVEARFHRDRLAGHGLIFSGPLLVASAWRRRAAWSTRRSPAVQRRAGGGAGLWPARVVGCPGAAEAPGSRAGRRPVAAATAQRPLRSEGQPRSLRGAAPGWISGGAAASVCPGLGAVFMPPGLPGPGAGGGAARTRPGGCLRRPRAAGGGCTSRPTRPGRPRPGSGSATARAGR